MAITKKPAKPLPEVEIAALIDKGGSVARKEGAKTTQFIQLRLDRDLITAIDAALHRRKVKIPRHTWILEALHEKLEREDAKLTSS